MNVMSFVDSLYDVNLFDKEHLSESPIQILELRQMMIILPLHQQLPVARCPELQRMLRHDPSHQARSSHSQLELQLGPTGQMTAP